MPRTSTGAIGITKDGTVQLYVPPNVVVIAGDLPAGLYTWSYGAPVNLAAGDPLPSTGPWQLLSGGLVAEAAITVTPMTLVPANTRQA